MLALEIPHEVGIRLQIVFKRTVRVAKYGERLLLALCLNSDGSQQHNDEDCGSFHNDEIKKSGG